MSKRLLRETEERSAMGVAVGYLYPCIVMNEALECSLNYTHTCSSTTRSHVHASDLRLASKEVEANISSCDGVIVGTGCDRSIIDKERVGEQPEAQALPARFETQQCR